MKHLALKSGFIGVMAALSLGAAVSGQVPAIVAEVDGLVLQSDQQLVGKDLVPLSHTQIRDPRSPEEWVEARYGATHSLPLEPVTLPDGRSGLTFLIGEQGAPYRHLVVEDEMGVLSHYRTPVNAANKDGIPAFREALDVELPSAGPGDLDAVDAAPEMTQAPASATPERAAQAASSYGTRLGSFNGVDVYSNGSSSYASNVYYTLNGYRTGMKWQCVEYTSRYFWQKFARKIAGGNANSFYSSALSKGLNRAPNGSTKSPQVGNLICRNGGSYGHCAIVSSVNASSGYLTVVHQNWSNTTADATGKQLTLSKKTVNGKTTYTVGGFSTNYPVVGWMWPCTGTCKEYK